MADPSAANVLTTKAPQVSTQQAEAITLAHYGVRASAAPLVGERDNNFHLKSADGRDFLLKLVNPAEDPALTDFQTKALLHIAARDAGLPVPRVVETLRGEPYFAFKEQGNAARIVRMLTFLPGTPLAKVERSAALPRNLGGGLARLDLALAGFEHPASRHELLWDLSHLAKLRPLLRHIADLEMRAVVEQTLDRLERQVLPRVACFRRQVIHNDFNPSNILVTGPAGGPQDQLAGIIDFGDMVEAPLINEVAVAASYHVAADGDFLRPIKAFASGYHAVLPLGEGEIGCLFDLILARMVQSVVIPAWRSTLKPGNRDYILRNAARARTGLMRAQALSPAEVADSLHDCLTRERLP